MTIAEHPCAVCTRPVADGSEREYGENCSHLACPNRRPLTAAPSSRGWRDDDARALLSEFDPWE